MAEVVELDARQTHDLRRALLRVGTASDVVTFEGDDEPTTFHLGVVLDDELVSISTWMSRRYPDLPGHPGHQLRGMATTPGARGSGVTADLLLAGLRRCSEAGSTVVWARARTTALRRRRVRPHHRVILHHGHANIMTEGCDRVPVGL